MNETDESRSIGNPANFRNAGADRISGTLALICAAAALLLGFVYKFTKPLIDRNTELSTEQSLNALVNGGNESIDTYYAVGFHKIETRAKNPNGSASVRNGRSVENRAGISRIYNVYDGGQMLGYVLELTGKGYGGDMLILAYYAPDGSVILRAGRKCERRDGCQRL